jgi:7,8-dihydroneopterin aldolase/epimerase/oxygenase
MSHQSSLTYALAERAWRHVFIRDLDLAAGKRRLRVNLDMAVIEELGATGDDLANVVCYEEMATGIRRLVAEDPAFLDETLAERIAAMSLKDPRVRRVRVRVEALGALSDAVSVGVEIERVAS